MNPLDRGGGNGVRSMSDTIRRTESLSPMFLGTPPTLRPNDVACGQCQRAFVVSAVVNRSSLRAHKERTEAAPMRIRRLCQRGTPELSPCREDKDFLSAPLILAKSGCSPFAAKCRTRREEKAKLCLEFELNDWGGGASC